MAKTITAANAVFTLAVPNLFDVPVNLQGFSADDIFSTDVMASAETSMGVDGRLSAGYVHVPVTQGVSLQADSDSNDFFEQWWQAMQLNQDVYFSEGVVVLLSVNRTWTLTKGVLTGFPPMPDAGRTLRARRFGLTWEKVSPAPII